jgi:hypothetical protein
MTRLRVCLRALLAVIHAQRRRGRRRERTKRRKKHGERMRLRALRKLGGKCACCGLGMNFARVLTFHHINHNGTEHQRALGALSVGLVTWLLIYPTPGEGLFAIEVLCEVCHKMHHEAGVCPHRWKRNLEAVSAA